MTVKIIHFWARPNNNYKLHQVKITLLKLWKWHLTLYKKTQQQVLSSDEKCVLKSIKSAQFVLIEKVQPEGRCLGAKPKDLKHVH